MDIKDIDFGKVCVSLNGRIIAEECTRAQEVVDLVLSALAAYSAGHLRQQSFRLGVSRPVAPRSDDPDRDWRRVVQIRGRAGG
jgi:hypothetical protein